MIQRRHPIGAEPVPGDGVSFRVWAPRRKRVDVVLNPSCNSSPDRKEELIELVPEEGGYHSGTIAHANPGDLYRFRLDNGDSFPDPVSRFQPEGPHGPSQIVDPSQFKWGDKAWRGITLPGLVIYEMHIGTFTKQGNFDAARRELAELARAGISAVEVMPVHDFPGRFGWGYDGVGLFAPVAVYGEPDDFRRFVNEAHSLGLGVILDVVYNHVGPDGDYLKQFSEDYFSTRYKCDWGTAINYDGENSAPVREWVITNARYWIEEFHLDGLRLDATQQIFDSSPENIITAAATAAKSAAVDRAIVIIAENERQRAILMRPPERGGYGVDGLWNDDFHHAARVAMTGRSEAYYSDYRGKPQELISASKYGFLFQGQRHQWQKKPRGTPALDLRPEQFVNFIQNHDQVANTGMGRRVHQLTSPGRYRAVTALLLLALGTPMLFQGQEFAASAGFCFFADHDPKLNELIREGRIKFLSQFPSLAEPEMRDYQIDPGDPTNFERCKLDFRERESHAPIYAMHKDLLTLRREDTVFRNQCTLDGAVLAEEAFVLRYFGGNRGDRLLLLNLGRDLHLVSAPTPLLAPLDERGWKLLWSSEDPRYGGTGTPPVCRHEDWRIPGHSAVVLRQDHE